MMTIQNKPLSIMVMYAVALHACWTFILLVDPTAVNATAVYALYRHIHPVELLVFVIGASTTCAIIGLFAREPLTVLLLIPQQILLVMSATGAAEAIWNAQFADGVVRARGFITADQIYSILGAAGHTIAVAAHAKRVVSTL